MHIAVMSCRFVSSSSHDAEKVRFAPFGQHASFIFLSILMIYSAWAQLPHKSSLPSQETGIPTVASSQRTFFTRCYLDVFYGIEKSLLPQSLSLFPLYPVLAFCTQGVTNEVSHGRRRKDRFRSPLHPFSHLWHGKGGGGEPEPMGKQERNDHNLWKICALG